MNDIPHIIHYCWFGSKSKPRNIRKYITSWKKMLPDYTFMEWNEQNCDLTEEIRYVQEAYRCKKYAFVSDYIRIQKLVEFGGIYLDTDVRIVRRFDKILNNHEAVLGFQGPGNLGTAFMAAIPHHPLFEEFLGSYSERRFIMEDGSFDMRSINVSLDPFVEKRGLIITQDRYQKLSENIGIYPTDYFCAFNLKDWYPEPTKRTCTIHYMASSWHSPKTKLKIAFFNIMKTVLGRKNYVRIRKALRSP